MLDTAKIDSFKLKLYCRVWYSQKFYWRILYVVVKKKVKTPIFIWKWLDLK